MGRQHFFLDGTGALNCEVIFYKQIYKFDVCPRNKAWIVICILLYNKSTLTQGHKVRDICYFTQFQCHEFGCCRVRWFWISLMWSFIQKSWRCRCFPWVLELEIVHGRPSMPFLQGLKRLLRCIHSTVSDFLQEEWSREGEKESKPMWYGNSVYVVVHYPIGSLSGPRGGVHIWLIRIDQWVFGGPKSRERVALEIIEGWKAALPFHHLPQKANDSNSITAVVTLSGCYICFIINKQ